MNLVTAPLGADGRLCVYASAAVDVVVDLLGVTDNPGPLRSITVSRSAHDQLRTRRARLCRHV